ncbi:MAG TPA: STAS domain-containing protein [Trebonia sp.]|jgi:anti-sigma B factor antagonist|nr:STAS domain-containing protein [Trebonia sp.]
MNDQAARMAPIVVALPPEIDVTNSEQVYEQLVAVLAPGVDTVIADMTSTVFCDSSGVHAIMHAYESAAARDVRMRLAVSPATSVRRVLELIGVGRLMPVYASLREALAASTEDEA